MEVLGEHRFPCFFQLLEASGILSWRSAARLRVARALPRRGGLPASLPPLTPVMASRGGAQGGQPQDPGNLPLSGFTYPLLQCPFDHGRWQSQVPGMSPWTSLGGSILPAASPFCASVRVLVHFSDRRRTCALFPHLSGQRPAREQPFLCPSSHPPAWLPSFLSTRSHPSRPSVHSHARLPSVCP